MISKLEILMENVDNMQEQIGNNCRETETLRIKKGNAKSKKHSNRNKEFLQWSH